MMESTHSPGGALKYYWAVAFYDFVTLKDVLHKTMSFADVIKTGPKGND